MEFWFSEAQTPNVKLSIRVDKQLYSGQSEFQRIDVFESPEFGRFLTLDGYMMLTEKDEFIYHEMITHVPMAVHPCVRRVLVIGAGDGGVIRELTRYPEIESIDMVEIDPQVVEVCREYLPQTACKLDDPRVHIHYEDGLKYIRRFEDAYDLIADAGIAENEIRLGDNEYFVMGDNCNSSEDSRSGNIGPVLRDHIVGEAWFKLGEGSTGFVH